MEPEKIDALFRQKMENFQKTPSADAWAKLQSRIEPPKKEEKKPVMWLYYAAASIMLVLVSGVLWLTRFQDNGNGTQLANQTKTEIQKSTETGTLPAQPETETAIARQKDQPERIGEGTTGNTASESDLTNQPSTQAAQLATVKANPENNRKNNALNAGFEKAPERTVATTKTDLSKPEKISPEPMLAIKPQPVKKEAGSAVDQVKKESLEILIIRDAPETEALAVTTQPEEEKQEKQSKLQLAKNIGKQLLNLKRGEKIDRTELGLPENYSIAFETKIAGQKISKSINL